jgi:putative DNA primase/helicase
VTTIGCPQVVPRELIAALAAEAPPDQPPPPAGPPPTTSRGSGPRLDVARWLLDRGVAFRVKPEPDAKGRTVYVLAVCPFDAAHADPDACVMQAPDGKLSAHCFHNGCTGRGWKAFKEALGPPDPDHYDPPLRPSRRPRRASPAPAADLDKVPGDGATSDESHTGPGAPLPTITGTKRQLPAVTADALAALVAANDPPTVLVRGQVLTRLRDRDAEDPPVLEPLTDSALRGVVARVARWIIVKDTKDGEVYEDGPPPKDVVRDLASLAGWPDIPPLRAVVESPVFAADGTLVDAPGYCPTARLWYSPAADLVVPAVPENPTAADVTRARDLLVVDLLGDFPFADDASRAHALAALLLPFVRPLIDGPTPLHLLDAPVEGTGKTLLASAIAVVSTGRDAEAVAEADSDEEWRKRITAVLAEGPTFVLLDNINRVLDSGALASALTTRTWKDRILGVSKTARLPVTCTWVASGNNTRLSRELIRRTLFCRLDAKTDTPWLREEFRHADLLAWAKANRGDLVWAALTLVRAWLAAGRPPGKARLGMYEAWAATVGGILDVAGVPGLLANAKAFRAARADQVGEWRAFIAAWWAKFGGRAVGVHDLFDLVKAEALLDSVVGDKGERSQRTRLGVELGRAADRVFGAYRVTRAGTDHKDRQLYQVVEVAPPGPAAPPAPAAPPDEAEWSA